MSPVNRAKDYFNDRFLREYSLEAPDNIVLAEAKKPNWLKSDTLVFEVQHGFHIDISDPSEPNVELFTGGATLEKLGSFWSLRKNAMGSWKMQENALYLTWPGSSQEETCIAVKSSRQWINKQSQMVIDIIQPAPDNPWWFQPSVIKDSFSSETHVCARDFECPVCYFELFRFPAAVVKRHSRRTCGHYFHYDCAKYLLKTYRKTIHGATCPVCGISFNDIRAMPDLMKCPREWFVTCDADMGGELSEDEVIEALGSVLPVNRSKLSKNVRAKWSDWDPDGDGTITMQEFMQEDRGLRDWVLKNLDQIANTGNKKSIIKSHMPALDAEPKSWFEYWDRDKSGSLDKEELCRSLIRTFCVDDNGTPVLTEAHDMREAANNLWKALGYTPFENVTFDEFVKPYGLMDQFLHNQSHSQYFGVDSERWTL
jgi:Ca2+-binding EF-hand superfamily protein